MGFFGKKAGSSHGPRSTGNYVAPAETPAPGPVSFAPTTATPEALLDDLEQSMQASVAQSNKTPKITKASVAPSKASVAPSVPTRGHDPDDLTGIFGDDPTTAETFDDTRTFRTEYTTPTLKTARSEDSKDSAFTITRNGEYLTMNGFANGHLMRWKFAAEEGPAFLRYPVILLALFVVGTTLYPIVTNHFYWTVSSVICAAHTCIMASFIFILEGRVVSGIRAPTSFRARIRAVITRYFNVFRLLWGRGLLYIFVGSMNLTIDHPYALYTGCALMGFGIIAIASGAHASYNLDKMKASLTDEAYLWSKFDALDHDHDNCIDLNGFAELLWSLGLEFDDAYTYKAFSQINVDAHASITFEQFRDWWIVTQNRGRSLRNSHD